MIARQDRGEVTVLRLAHGKASALDLELLEALEAELRAADEPGRSLVLTGTGSIFSAGVDLRRLLDGGEEYVGRFLPVLDRGLRALFLHPRPVVAAINGHALAGGWILAAACDYRVMASGRARGGVPELEVGVPFPGVPLEVLRHATPRGLLSSLVLAGRRFSAEEAVSCGLVEEFAVPAEVVDRAVAVARDMAARPADAFALTKRRLREPARRRMDELPELEPEVHRAWTAPATFEVIRAFVERNVGRGRG